MNCGVPAMVPLRVMRRIIDRAGEPEVGQERSLNRPVEQDVGRFDISMHQPLSMCGGQAPRHLQTDPQNLLQLQWALLVNSLLQAGATGILRDDVRHALPLVDAVDRQHMVVNHRSGSLPFPREAFSGRPGRREMRQQHFDGHKTIQCCVERFEDDPHPAAADDSGHLVRPDSPQHARIIGWPQQTECRFVADPMIRLIIARFIAGTRQITASVAQDRENGLCPGRFDSRFSEQARDNARTAKRDPRSLSTRRAGLRRVRCDRELLSTNRIACGSFRCSAGSLVVLVQI